MFGLVAAAGLGWVPLFTIQFDRYEFLKCVLWLREPKRMCVHRVGGVVRWLRCPALGPWDRCAFLLPATHDMTYWGQCSVDALKSFNFRRIFCACVSACVRQTHEHKLSSCECTVGPITASACVRVCVCAPSCENLYALCWMCVCVDLWM